MPIVVIVVRVILLLCILGIIGYIALTYSKLNRKIEKTMSSPRIPGKVVGMGDKNAIMTNGRRAKYAFIRVSYMNPTTGEKWLNDFDCFPEDIIAMKNAKDIYLYIYKGEELFLFKYDKERVRRELLVNCKWFIALIVVLLLLLVFSLFL